MPVLSKQNLRKLNKELNDRFFRLYSTMGERQLKSPNEDGRWQNPDNMRATVGTASEIRLAVEDFKTILTEIKRLK